MVYFSFQIIMNKVGMSIYVLVFCEHIFSITLGKYFVVELLGYMVSMVDRILKNAPKIPCLLVNMPF